MVEIGEESGLCAGAGLPEPRTQRVPTLDCAVRAVVALAVFLTGHADPGATP